MSPADCFPLDPSRASEGETMINKIAERKLDISNISNVSSKKAFSKNCWIYVQKQDFVTRICAIRRARLVLYFSAFLYPITGACDAYKHKSPDIPKIKLWAILKPRQWQIAQQLSLMNNIML